MYCIGSFSQLRKELIHWAKVLKAKNMARVSSKKDGWYIARFVDKCGTRHDKYFKTLPEARIWQADSQYHDQHGSIFVPVNMMVDAWFEYWTQNIVLENRRAGQEQFL